MEPEEVDITTSLRGEIAGLQYKRDRLNEELNEMKCQFRNRDQRCMELQVEADQLREQTARQNAVISSLKKRIHDLEERERNLYSTQGRNEIAIQSLQRDNKYLEDKVKEMEKKIRSLEIELSAEEQKKEAARGSFQELVRRLAVALGSDCCESSHMPAEALVHKASELVQVYPIISIIYTIIIILLLFILIIEIKIISNFWVYSYENNSGRKN